MAIKQLIIDNFQSHRRTILDFHPGVNVIIGLSQSGKTAILRALNWVINNRPPGFRFHSSFTEDKNTSVVLKFDEGLEVGLWKDGREAKYSISDGNRIEAFEGFGQKVPDKVLDVLNISELNVQNQLDTPFLITSSSGEIARTINRITKLEKVDEWQSKLTSEINYVKRQIELKEKEAEEIQDELSKYKGIEDVERLVDQAMELSRRMSKVNEVIDALESFIEKEELLESEIEKQESVFGVEEQLKEAEEIFSGIKDSKRLCRELKERVEQIEREKIKINDLENDIEENVVRQVELLKRLGKCPLCLSRINKRQMERIINEYSDGI